MRAFFPRLLLAAAGLGILGLPLGGCAHYQMGSVMHPQFKTVGVGVFRNATDDAELSVCLRQNLADSLMTDGSLTLTDSERADAVVQGSITGYSVGSVAASKVNVPDAKKNNLSDYETTTYRAEVEVEFEVRMPGLRRPVLAKQRVRGSADFSPQQDLNVARREGLRRAAQDAAQKISAAVTEGW